MTHKILRFLRVGKSKAHHFDLKIDMSKAYDRVEWKLVIAMMKKIGFSSKWCKWIWECMSSVSYKIIVNDSLGNQVIPCRRIRQGHPISPFLFLLCA